MSTLRFYTAAFAIAALAGLSTAQAQTAPDQPRLQGNQPPGTQADQNGRYEARRVSYDANNLNQQGPTVVEALLRKLMKANEAEIELAKMARQKTDNQEVEELAQMIVRDHQALNATLRQHLGQDGLQERQQRQNGQDARRTRTGETADTSRDRTRENQLTRDEQAETRPGSGTAMVPKQLCEIAEQACDNALKMTKEMLSKYDGQDFNMAFLGQQCVAHTLLLAELKAIESTGPEQLKDVAQKAAEKVERHLEKAKELARELEDDN